MSALPSWIKHRTYRSTDGELMLELMVRKWHPMFWYEVIKGVFKCQS